MPAKTPPPFRRILDDLEGRIARAELRPGEALPTRVELAVQYDAARATVDKALGELVRRGLVSGGSGRRTVVLSPAAPAQTAIGVLWNWTP
ncbi:GntR family transcriptional regulator, partial [bacterium]